LTKRQLAAHLNYSTRWVEQQVKAGMPHERWGGRLRFQVSAVEAWLKERFK
jgi:excisionase family DNA binding protein